MFCPVRYIIVVFSGSCLALWSSRMGRVIWLFCFSLVYSLSLRKHAYSNVLKILPPKTENFQKIKTDIFHISAQNIDCEAVLTSTHNLCFSSKIRK